ncbi:hypothetical protein FWK35_00002636 [Aphis craccivora]|uniref:Uncharacterized protein n=1 Tax=Aphis craccivora TaxID=307492 RepID=A0A6G0ZRD3_APHCR|nr:hypothetical protein FWK35_00002636 [Aphis craccivora]
MYAHAYIHDAKAESSGTVDACPKVLPPSRHSQQLPSHPHGPTGRRYERGQQVLARANVLITLITPYIVVYSGSIAAVPGPAK